MDKTKEAIADVQHKIWSHWMGYLFMCCSTNSAGEYIIPKDKVDRWDRLRSTDYHDLTEEEKKSDRIQADRVLEVTRPRKVVQRGLVNISRTKVYLDGRLLG